MDLTNILDTVTNTAGNIKQILAPTPATAPAPAPAAAKTNWLLIGGIGAAVLLLIVGLVTFTKK
jgi:hypothetical protein